MGMVGAGGTGVVAPQKKRFLWPAVPACLCACAVCAALCCDERWLCVLSLAVSHSMIEPE